MSGGATAFAVTTDTAAYVPYAEAERVLASLEEWVCEAQRPMRVLRGAQGSGKSMLLAVFAERVGRHAVPVRVSANGLDPETLARSVLDALGAPWEGTPRVALARAVEQLGTRRVLLLLDDADALAPRTEMWLFDFVRRSAGAVHALLAVRDERLAAEFAKAFQAGTTVLALDAPMSREEAHAWVNAELARSAADTALRARFDAATVARLHARSGGVPGRLRQEAAAIVAEFSAGSDGRAPRAAREERAPVAAAPPRPAPATAGGRAPSGPPGAGGVTAAAPARQPSAGREPVPRETPVTRREPASARAAAAAVSREPSASRSASAARSAAVPAPANPTRVRAEATPSLRAAPRRDPLLRWLLVPAALAASYVAGFLTAQTLEAPAVEPPAVSAAPPREPERSAAPPLAELGAPEPFTPPSPPLPAEAPTPPPVAAPAGDGAEAVAASAAERAEREAAAPEPVEPEAVATGPETALGDAAPAVSAAPPPAPARRSPPRPRSVEVSVEAEPGASIRINGQPVGSGTVKGLELAPGPHLVEVRLPDGRAVERVIEVKGTRYDIKVR